MGRSLIKLAILAALVVFSWRLLLQAPPSRSQDEYVAALIDKDELLGSTLGPRFLFVGGSNLAFGLDSTMVEEAAGLPVVNCGLHANLGLQFMLNRARIHLTEGDIVVLCPEYDAPPQINPDLLIYLASVGIHPRQGDISSSWSQWCGSPALAHNSRPRTSAAAARRRRALSPTPSIGARASIAMEISLRISRWNKRSGLARGSTWRAPSPGLSLRTARMRRSSPC